MKPCLIFFTNRTKFFEFKIDPEQLDDNWEKPFAVWTNSGWIYADVEDEIIGVPNSIILIKDAALAQEADCKLRAEFLKKCLENSGYDSRQVYLIHHQFPGTDNIKTYQSVLDLPDINVIEDHHNDEPSCRYFQLANFLINKPLGYMLPKDTSLADFIHLIIHKSLPYQSALSDLQNKLSSILTNWDYYSRWEYTSDTAQRVEIRDHSSLINAIAESELARAIVTGSHDGLSYDWVLDWLRFSTFQDYAKELAANPASTLADLKKKLDNDIWANLEAKHNR